MRTARWLRCATAGSTTGATAAPPPPPSSAAADAGTGRAATGAPPPPPPSPTPSSPTPSAKGSGTKTGPSAKAWHSLQLRSWQLHTVESAEDRASMPTTVFYHGDQLGPRPLVILDHSVPRAAGSASAAEDACSEATKKYEALLASLAWDHGAVYVPLPVSMGEVNVMEQSCRHVGAVLDALDVRWSHFLGHSYGALVAARMAASTAHPHRIGSLLLLDTPLVTEPLVRNTQQREELAKARQNVNVPPAELSFAIESLKAALEAPLPHPATADKSLYEDYLFAPATLFREDGLVRDEHRYVPVRHLAQIHHPLQLLAPAKQPVADVAIHKEFFNLRRPAAIKTAERHEDLFSTKCAAEVADVVRAWMQRFEPDAVMKRRFEQAAKEMSQLMGSSAASGESGGAATEKKPEKKKEKKKKGK